MPRTPLLALGFGCTVGLLILYGGELGLRLAHTDPGGAAVAAAARSGHPFDARTRRQVVEALHAEGRDAVPRIVPSGLLEQEGGQEGEGSFRSRLSHADRELLPLAGISSRTTVLCNETGTWAVYDADEHGFRNPKGLWSRAPADLVLLGDSFTIGECVGPGENVGDRLRERWPATLNLGYSGNSPLFELATLAEYGPTLRPRVTLWLYFENDLSWFDLGQSRRTPLLMRYLDGDPVQGLIQRQPEIDAALTALLDTRIGQPDDESPASRLAAASPPPGERVQGFLRLQSLRARLAGLRGAARSLREPADYPLFARVLERARGLAASWKGELVVVYLPGVWNFDPHSRGPAFADPGARAQLRSMASARGLGFIDIHEALAAHADPLSLYSYRGDSILGSPHMNAEGYALVASTIEAWLDAQPSALSEPQPSALSEPQPSALRSQISRQ